MDKELDALFHTATRDDGTDPEFEEIWANLVHQAARPTPQTSTTAVAKPVTGTAGPTRSATPGQPRTPAVGPVIRPLTRPPRVGTIVQRSSGAQAKRLAVLMATPPPPPRRRPQKTIRPVRPPTAKSRLTELFGDPLSDISDEERPRETTPPAAASPPATDGQPGQRPVPPPSQPTNITGPTAITPTYGPTTPPPVKVDIGQGIVVSVPHFAVHISRRYKARVGERRFVLRFDHSGRCRYHREI